MYIYYAWNNKERTTTQLNMFVKVCSGLQLEMQKKLCLVIQTCCPQWVPESMLGAVVNSISCWAGLSLLPWGKKTRKDCTCRFSETKITNYRRTTGQLTRKWTSNHPPKPPSLVLSTEIDDEKFDLTSRMSPTVAVKQSISFMMAAVPITWCGWRLFHNDVYDREERITFIYTYKRKLIWTFLSTYIILTSFIWVKLPKTW